MKLQEFIEQYLASKDVSVGYSNQLRWMCNSLARTAGRDVSITELNVDLVNSHLKQTRGSFTPETRKSHRRMLLTLWQAAADENLLADPPRRKIMQIKVPDKIHKAWTPDRVKALVAASALMKGYYQCGVRRHQYWRSYVLAAWDSGLRGCDLRLIEKDSINDDGWCVLVQQKTGKLIRILFRPETLTAINDNFPPVRELVWPLWGRLECWRREARKLVKLAGLSGSIGRLRHSSGTAVEMQHPGRGHEHLGNTRAVFERNYLDHQMIAARRVLPDSLV